MTTKIVRRSFLKNLAVLPRFYVKNQNWLGKVAELCRSAGIIGIDVETTPLDGWKHDPSAGLDPFKARIRLIQIATEEMSWIIDLNYVTDVTPILEVLSDPKVLCVIHNAKFETSFFLRQFGVYPDPIFDTQLASRMFQSVYDYTWRNSLEAVVQRNLYEQLDKTQQVSNWGGELSESQLNYAYKDAEVLIPLYKILSEKLTEEGMMWSAQAEFGCVLSIAEMELTGLVLDREIHKQLSDIIEERLAKLRRYLAAELPSRQFGLFEPEGINLNSSAQVLDAFEKRTGVRLTKRERGEKWGEWFEKESADKTALLRQRQNHQVLVDALLDYGSLVHDYDTHCATLTKYVHPVTGKIHPEINQLGQWQARTATKNPPLNFPRPDSFGPGVSTPALIENFKAPMSFRQLFRAPEGRLYSIADFAGNQARIIADTSFANENSLIEEFNSSAPDPYRRIASIGLGKPRDQVSKVERFAYKTLFLALMFGAGVDRFMQTRLEETRLEMSRSQAEAEISSFFRALPRISRWHANAKPELEQRGYVVTPRGRKIFFPANRITKNRATNFPICATEKDGAALAAGKISREIRRQGLDAKPVMFVYDELVYDCAENDAQTVLDLQCRIMKESMDQCLTSVPAAVEGVLGKSWGDKK